jgi:undecaprenyl-diphosphatase
VETFFQQFILGMIQGIFEWIPISSKSVLLLVMSHFSGGISLEQFIKQALFLHLGTFFAALIYFRKDVAELFHGLFYYKRADSGIRKTLRFLIITTIISGVMGLAFLELLKFVDTRFIITSKIITFFIGFFLLFTGFFQLKVHSAGIRNVYHLNDKDSIFLGFMQGLAAIPGLSRSGMTISSLLFRNVDETTAIRLSFIMSMPIVLAGNILLNFSSFTFISSMLWGLLFSFLFGILTINLLMRLSKKIRFGWFVIFIAIMMIIAAFLPISLL